MHFMAEVDGHEVKMDTVPRGGGEDRGMSPKAMLLSSLGGCTGMDVIMVLRKMRAEPEHFTVELEANVTDSHPKVFEKIHITYRFKGGNVTREKAEHAIRLSQDQYCGVSAMLKKAAPIEWEIVIEN
jgi:putative redox protein